MASWGICPSCRDEVIPDGGTGIMKYKCGHPSHNDCAYGWWIASNRVIRCPMCRDVERTADNNPPQEAGSQEARLFHFLRNPTDVQLLGLNAATWVESSNSTRSARALPLFSLSSEPRAESSTRANNNPPHEAAGSQEGMDDDEASALALSLESNRYTIWVESRTRANNNPLHESGLQMHGANNVGLANQSGIRSGARQGPAASFFDSHN